MYMYPHFPHNTRTYIMSVLISLQYTQKARNYGYTTVPVKQEIYTQIHWFKIHVSDRLIWQPDQHTSQALHTVSSYRLAYGVLSLQTSPYHDKQSTDHNQVADTSTSNVSHISDTSFQLIKGHAKRMLSVEEKQYKSLQEGYTTMCPTTKQRLRQRFELLARS